MHVGVNVAYSLAIGKWLRIDGLPDQPNIIAYSARDRKPPWRRLFVSLLVIKLIMKTAEAVI